MEWAYKVRPLGKAGHVCWKRTHLMQCNCILALTLVLSSKHATNELISSILFLYLHEFRIVECRAFKSVQPLEGIIIMSLTMPTAGQMPLSHFPSKSGPVLDAGMLHVSGPCRWQHGRGAKRTRT